MSWSSDFVFLIFTIPLIMCKYHQDKQILRNKQKIIAHWCLFPWLSNFKYVNAIFINIAFMLDDRESKALILNSCLSFVDHAMNLLLILLNLHFMLRLVLVFLRLELYFLACLSSTSSTIYQINHHQMKQYDQQTTSIVKVHVKNTRNLIIKSNN